MSDLCKGEPLGTACPPLLFELSNTGRALNCVESSAVPPRTQVMGRAVVSSESMYLFRRKETNGT